MAYVTGILKEEQTVYFVETKGMHDIPPAEGKLQEKGCENIQLWAVYPTFENEYFTKAYPDTHHINPL